MCLPEKSDQPTDSSGSQTRSLLVVSVLTLLACLAGPTIAGAVGALGVGAVVGAGAVVLAIALCLVVPAATVTLRRRSAP
jgi:hypothetical protein